MYGDTSAVARKYRLPPGLHRGNTVRFNPGNETERAKPRQHWLSP